MIEGFKKFINKTIVAGGITAATIQGIEASQEDIARANKKLVEAQYDYDHARTTQDKEKTNKKLLSAQEGVKVAKAKTEDEKNTYLAQHQGTTIDRTGDYQANEAKKKQAYNNKKERNIEYAKDSDGNFITDVNGNFIVLKETESTAEDSTKGVMDKKIKAQRDVEKTRAKHPPVTNVFVDGRPDGRQTNINPNIPPGRKPFDLLDRQQ